MTPRFAVLLVSCTVLAGWTAAAGGQDTPGKREYVRAGCDSCHGPEAHGAGQAPELAGITRPYPEFVKIVREGIGEMPPHSKDDVSDEQLAAIYQWLKSLSPKAPHARSRGAH